MIELCERKVWGGSNVILLIGPGGAGKSSLGVELAPLLKRRLVDLDQEFHRRIGDISAFIRNEGYDRYKLRNSELAVDIKAEALEATILVTSSGFLTDDNPQQAIWSNKSLLSECYSVCMLPSRDLELAVKTIVDRQLARPFSRNRTQEEAAIRNRYPIYARLGDLTVFSTAPSREIARAVVPLLGKQE